MGIPLDEVGLLRLFLETLFYGASSISTGGSGR
jgi:hypothetical protein